MKETSVIAINTAVITRLMVEVWGDGQLHVIPDLVATDFIGHFPIGDHYGPEGVRIDIASYRAALPDLTVTIDDLFAFEDKVVRRYTLRGTHRHPSSGAIGSEGRVMLHAIAIDRLDDGRILESWVEGDRIPP